MKKRFLSILLVLVMVIGMIPFSALSASAATSGTGTETDPYVVTTYEELMDLMKESSTAYIKLGCNIAPKNTTNELYTIYVFGNKTLDLNGYSLTRTDYNTADTSMIEVRSGGSLTINDTSSAKTGSINAEGRNMCATILIVSGGSLIMNEGYVNGYCTLGSAYAAIVSRGSVTVNGGTYASGNMSGLLIEGGTCTIYDGNFLQGLNLWGGNTNIYGGVFGNEEDISEEAISISGEIDTGSTPSAYIRNATLNGQFDAVEFDNLTLKNCVINNGITIWKSRKGERPAISTFLADGFGLYLDGVLSTATDTRYEASKIEVKFNGDLNMGFASLTPTPDMDEADWDELASNLGTMALGSADTNINFNNFSAKALSAEAIAAGYSVKRALKVTRDGIPVYDKEYESNEVYDWNLKDNIDEGGNYHIIPQLNYYLDGVKVAEISHLYTVKVTGSTIKTISLAGIGTPVIGKAPSTIDTAISNTDGVIIKKVQWEYWTSEMGGVWVNMPNGSVFEEGKRYAVLVELEPEVGYSLAANKSDMTVYINGEACNVFNHDASETAAELEFTPITTPAFTTQPVGGMVAEGEKLTVDWNLNFVPVKIELRYFDNASEESTPTYVDTSITSADFASIPDDGSYYQILAYYNDAQCVASNKFYVKEIKRISEINVTVTPPKAGETPTDATTTEDGYTIKTVWWVLEEDGQYRPFEGNFEAGKQYAVYTHIEAKAGYEFIAKPTFKVNGSSNTIRIGSTDSYYTGVYEFFTINSIELQVAKPVIGEAPTKPTIKSVNGDESLKDKVKFFADNKVYWNDVPTTNPDDWTGGNYTKNPATFEDGHIYALHYVIQSIDATIAENCVVYIYDTDGTLLYSGGVKFSDPADNTLVNADAVLGNFKLELGNVNGDANVDFTDLQRLYQHIIGEAPLTGDALAVADVNGDNNVDFSDLQALFTLVS